MVLVSGGEITHHTTDCIINYLIYNCFEIHHHFHHSHQLFLRHWSSNRISERCCLQPAQLSPSTSNAQGIQLWYVINSNPTANKDVTEVFRHAESKSGHYFGLALFLKKVFRHSLSENITVFVWFSQICWVFGWNRQSYLPALYPCLGGIVTPFSNCDCTE